MSLPGPRFTWADYRLLPEDKRAEVIEGELLMTPAPSVRHQAIVGELHAAIRAFTRANRLGQVLMAPVDVILADDNVIQPDLLFVSEQRRAVIDPSAGVNGAPDLVVEVLSPGTAGRDRLLKRKLYGRFGVREYWIVDPETRSVEVLSLGQSELETYQVFTPGTDLASPLLPGLIIHVDEVFAF